MHRPHQLLETDHCRGKLSPFYPKSNFCLMSEILCLNNVPITIQKIVAEVSLSGNKVLHRDEQCFFQVVVKTE